MDADKVDDDSISSLSSLPGNPPCSIDCSSSYSMALSTSTMSTPVDFKPTSNLKFKPLPSTSGYCSKLKLNLIFDSNIFIGGQAIQGRMELVSLTDSSLLLGEIALHFSAYEEISDKSFHQSSALYSSRVLMQGPNLPPSEAVRGAPTKEGYYTANRKKTIYPFSFDIPSDAPSSFNFNGCNARLRYVVTGSAEFKYGAQKDILFKSKDFKVLERWSLADENSLAVPCESSNSRKLFLGGDGEVSMSASIEKDFLIAGSTVGVCVRVENKSKKRVQGFKISFVKRLLTISSAAIDEEDRQVKITDESHQTFHFRDELYEPLDERSTTAHTTVPIDSQTIRNTNLAEVRWLIVVSLQMPGLLSKDLVVELPVKICHPNSLITHQEGPSATILSQELVPRLPSLVDSSTAAIFVPDTVPVLPPRKKKNYSGSSSANRSIKRKPTVSLNPPFIPPKGTSSPSSNDPDPQNGGDGSILDISGLGYILEKALQLWDSTGSSPPPKPDKIPAVFPAVTTIYNPKESLPYSYHGSGNFLGPGIGQDGSQKKRRGIRKAKPLPREPLPRLPPTIAVQISPDDHYSGVYKEGCYFDDEEMKTFTVRKDKR